ncbi:unnamed protein product [Ilex paraguariensis]|uniref:Putative plant transposon protein domain-containing protein n=1 Tax=Ilex paraguariensis TaxID=185542 RepID=A0ABC8TAZ7_9AQUA
MATVIQRICIGSVPWENEKSKIAHTDLTPTYRMINRIVACNIHPRGHTVEIAYDTAQLLYAIEEHEVIIDLPLYIFNHVREASAVEDDRPCLPFPILVSKILKHNVVEFQQNDSFIYPMNSMGMGTLNKSVEAILGVKQGKCVKKAAAVIIDLSLYIFNHVREASAVEDDRPCLPFPILVSKILKHNVVEFQQNDSFIYPMNSMGMGTLNKSVEAILGVKQGKCVKQAAAMGASTELSSHTSLAVKSGRLILHQDHFGLSTTRKRRLVERLERLMEDWAVDLIGLVCVWGDSVLSMSWCIELSLGFLFELDCIGLFMMDFVFSGGLTLKIAAGMLMWRTIAVSWAVTKGAGAEFGYIANQLGLNGCCTGLFLIWGFCIRSCLGVQELD